MSMRGVFCMASAISHRGWLSNFSALTRLLSLRTALIQNCMVYIDTLMI